MNSKIFSLLLSSLVSFSVLAKKSSFKMDLDGHIEIQGKSVETQDDKPASENWNGQQGAWLFVGNFDAKFHYKKHTVDTNAVIRYTGTTLYNEDKKPNSAKDFIAFPTNLVTRDIFRLEHTEQTEEGQTDALLNQFSYTFGDEETEFKLGRQFISYGSGKVFNPLNPFDYSQYFSTLYNLHPGNDGLSFHLKQSQTNTVHLYLLGDKKFYDEGDRIARTIWARGRKRLARGLYFSYVLGEDQDRYSYGGEIFYKWGNHRAYLQGLKQSQRIDDKNNSESLSHFVFGFTRIMWNKWTFTLETGKQDRDELQNFRPTISYIPMENYIALLNEVKLNQKYILDIHFLQDPKSSMTYSHINLRYKDSKSSEFNAFIGRTLVSADNEAEYALERSVPHQLGLGYRYLF
jgi:hypothetical protein